MYDKRMANVIENMKRDGLDQLLVTSIPSVYYLTGVWVHDLGERMLALYLNADGDAHLFIHQMFVMSLKGYPHFETFSDTDDCVSLVASRIRPGTLGVDKFWPTHFTLRLMAALPQVTVKNGSAPVDRARMCKDGEEIRLLRESSRLNDIAVTRTIAGIREGMTEKELGNLYIRIAEELSPEGSAFAPNTSFGPNTADSHHNNTLDTLKRGDNVLIDVGLLYGRYFSDMTRTVFLGNASDEQKRLYDVVRRANEAGRAAVRPGVPMSAFDAAARKVIDDAGYGQYFLTRTGHGIGLECHEFPDNSPACQILAQPGMCFSVEPSVSLAGRFGIRVEDLVLVTEDGCETLNHLDRELTVLP